MNWVLLNGLTRLATQWWRFEDELRARFPGDRVVPLDLPGVGAADDRAAPLSVHAAADDVRARWLDATGGNGRWGVVGLSLGGMLTLSWVARHPADLAAAVVVNTSAAGCGHPLQRLRPASFRMLVAARLAGSPRERERRALALTCEDPAVREAAAAALGEALEAGAPGDLASARQLLSALWFRAPRRVDVPLLVLSARGDRMVAPACSAKLAARLGADHREHPWGGHDVEFDAPEWCADRVVEWAARLPGAADGE